jgi:putative chitobiose transport system permease protein
MSVEPLGAPVGVEPLGTPVRGDALATEPRAAVGAVTSVARGAVLEPAAVLGGRRARSGRRRRAASTAGWYVVLTGLAVITVFPFLWMLLTSLKGPADPITSVPPQFIPGHPTLANYQKVLASLPILTFFQNSIVVAVLVTGLNVLVSAMAAYPLAKMQFRGREAIFYLLLATLIVPAQLTYIPSFVLAVNVFHTYDTLAAVILPGLASAFNIFLMRQAFRGVPNDLIDAARVDGAGEWRVWWQILLPIVRPSMAAVAIFTFVTSWNDFLWPSLMLHDRDGMTLPVGLAALQGFFSSDFRSIAAGVTMTVLPILLFFIVVQRWFVRGLAGAVKG